jgi:uncharacterized membrane protein
MKPKHFLSHLQHDQIVKAIRDAETRTTGTLHLFISHAMSPDPVAAAQKEFKTQGLDQLPQQNAILIFIAPRSHTFAVIGGDGIHKQCGDEFWEELTREMAAHFKSGSFTPAVLHAIHRAAEVLVRHFPRA